LSGVFDVFLCHHENDEKRVALIAEQLRDASLNPWLAASELRPGLPWQPVLEREIENMKAAAVFLLQRQMYAWNGV